MDDSPYATNFKDICSEYILLTRLRYRIRNTAIFLMSLSKRLDQKKNWIHFPFYHHVFVDERKGFARQMEYLRNYGEFVSIDDAAAILKSNSVKGRFFCVTFDDGFRNCMTNAMPIMLDKNIVAGIFVPTLFIGTSLESKRDTYDLFFAGATDFPVPVEFMTWDDVRTMAASGMVIGSHSMSHGMFSSLGDEEVITELRESKKTIERELGRPCNHFSYPFGVPGEHFSVNRDPALVKNAGYKSCLTTERGSNSAGDSQFFIKRNSMLAGEGNYHLRYFLSS